MSIRDWPAAERPREKLLQQGAAALSDAELLAIFLRTGVAGRSAVDLSRHLLNEFGSLRALLEADLERFSAHLGLGPAKFAQLQAVLEMARRHLAERMRRESALESPQAVRDYLKARLRHEHMSCSAAFFWIPSTACWRSRCYFREPSTVPASTRGRWSSARWHRMRPR